MPELCKTADDILQYNRIEATFKDMDRSQVNLRKEIADLESSRRLEREEKEEALKEKREANKKADELRKKACLFLISVSLDLLISSL